MLRIVEVLSKSLFMKLTPGAKIDDAKGEMKVMAPRREMSNHFLDLAKLSGISGSSWDSHPTILLARSESGRGAEWYSFCFFLLREVRRLRLLVLVAVW